MLVGIGRVGMGVLIALAIFTAFSAVMRARTVTLPAVTGSAAVGRTEIMLSDTQRTDPFASDGRSRELAVWIWYPATAGSSDEAAPYLPSSWAPLVNNLGPFSQDLSTVVTNSRENADLEGRPPVVMLLPGLGQPVASYTALAEDLASHGYAVVGINPTESVDVVFPDGHLVPATALGAIAEPNIDAWYESAGRVTDVWVSDAQFVATSLAAGVPDLGELDWQHVAYVGHSIGGAAAFEACRQDQSCSAAVDLDGTLWTDVRQSGLAAPGLVLHGASAQGCGEFCDRAAADFETVAAAGNTQQFVVAGTEHLSFSDLGLMWGPVTSSLLGDIDAERMVALMRDTVRSFLDVHVRGAAADTFSVATAAYSELR